MDTEQLIARLIAGQLAESLQVEFKQTIDIAADAGVVKLICALFALRNRDGGHLFIGVTNDGNIADAEASPPANLAGLTSDAIHGLIARYASDSFGVEVRPHPDTASATVIVIAVPGGIQSPVIVASGLAGTALTPGTIFFRTLDANGTPSSSKIPWQSWNDLLQICFENRETQIAGFIRRNFGAEAIKQFCEFACKVPPEGAPPTAPETAPVPAPPAAPAPQTPPAPVPAAPAEPAPPHPAAPITLPPSMIREGAQASIMNYLVEQVAVSDAVMLERNGQPRPFGVHATAAMPSMLLTSHSPSRKFLEMALNANPNLTGWPAWLDSRSFREEDERPYVLNEGWEAILSGGSWSGVEGKTERWRIEASGRQFLYTGYQDDIEDHPKKPKPNTQLDFGLVILRVAERLEVARRMIASLQPPSDTEVHFAFQFDRLRGRKLTSWANPGRYLSPGQSAQQDIVRAQAIIPLDANQQVLVDTTLEIANKVFRIFDGFEISQKVVEDMVLRLLQRRL